MTINKKTQGLAGGAILLIGCGAWYLTHGHGTSPLDKQASAGASAATVNTVPAIKQDVPVMLQANGTVVPLSSVDLHPQITNTIREVHIREGNFVRSGDLLFTLDDRTEQAGIARAQAQLARDQASLADLDRQYKRSQELLAQKFIAQSAADAALSQVNAQRALIKSDEAAIRSAQITASYDVIRAPMAGRVGAINVFPGSLVQLATSLVTITQLNPILVSFTLPESSLQRLLNAQKAGPVAVQASPPDSSRPATGVLSFIDNTVDPQAGTIRVKARFDNRETLLWPGQYANVSIAVQTLKDAVVIPQAAIITNTGGKLVYTMEADQTAKSRPVTVLYPFGTNAAVSGLSGGEKVIVEGKQNLRPGAKVHEGEPAASEGKKDTAG